MSSSDLRTRAIAIFRVAFVLACVFGALGIVAWRQTRTYSQLREIDRLQREADAVRAEIAVLQRRLQRLQSRSHIVDVAGKRLGLRLPESKEIMILPDPVWP